MNRPSGRVDHVLTPSGSRGIRHFLDQYTETLTVTRSNNGHISTETLKTRLLHYMTHHIISV